MDTNQKIVRHEARGNEMATLFPPVDVIEDQNGITVTADLPGVTKETLTIRADSDMLTVEGVISLGESESLEPIYAEVRAAQYKRSFTLSRELDTGQIAASIKDGVLTLHVPKLEQAKPRRIEVKVG